MIECPNDKEAWRPIPLGRLARESLYDVSSLGRVRNRETGKILKPYLCPTRNGEYLKVDLRNGSRHQEFVHRLVAKAYVSNPAMKPEVNHFDEDTFNNQASNLEWATRSEQEAHKRFMRDTA